MLSVTQGYHRRKGESLRKPKRRRKEMPKFDVPGKKNLEIRKQLKKDLPETYRIMKATNLNFYPNVVKVTVHGSRGPKGGYKPNSDLDMCLVTDLNEKMLTRELLGKQMRIMLEYTLEDNRGPVELDLAIIFDQKGCGLKCLEVKSYADLKCDKQAKGCMGIYKIQKGYDGFVPPFAEVKDMYPYALIWIKEL
jgi:predicted nucleotidyltransferase